MGPKASSTDDQVIPEVNLSDPVALPAAEDAVVIDQAAEDKERRRAFINSTKVVGTAKGLLDAELSSVIGVLRRMMGSARFFSDTGPMVW
jgi:hypothetical protein